MDQSSKANQWGDEVSEKKFEKTGIPEIVQQYVERMITQCNGIICPKRTFVIFDSNCIPFTLKLSKSKKGIQCPELFGFLGMCCDEIDCEFPKIHSTTSNTFIAICFEKAIYYLVVTHIL